jgi:hypothetical protein
MNAENKVRIHDGRTIGFNAAFMLELATLLGGQQGAGQAVEDLEAQGVNVAAEFAQPQGNKMELALSLVRLIGAACGEEARRRNFDLGADLYRGIPEDWEGENVSLLVVFAEGFMSGEPPKEQADGTMEGICRECGKFARMMVGAALPSYFEYVATPDSLELMVCLACNAYIDGLYGQMEA